jgi:hypothetical protein
MSRAKPTPKRAEADVESTRQASQAELLDRAMRSPGVAEAVEIYGRFAPFAPQQHIARTQVRHSTGGNV